MSHFTVRTALAGLLAALAGSGCDSQAAIHQLAAVADGWSDLPKLVWPPPPRAPLDETAITPVESAGASCADAAADAAATRAGRT